MRLAGREKSDTDVTTADLDHYQTERALTVDMKTATLFAIARYWDMAAEAIFSPFDRLTDEEWTFSTRHWRSDSKTCLLSVSTSSQPILNPRSLYRRR